MNKLKIPVHSRKTTTFQKPVKVNVCKFSMKLWQDYFLGRNVKDEANYRVYFPVSLSQRGFSMANCEYGCCYMLLVYKLYTCTHVHIYFLSIVKGQTLWTFKVISEVLFEIINIIHQCTTQILCGSYCNNATQLTSELAAVYWCWLRKDQILNVW